ncbi:MAG TPA: hypothetical protein PK826_09550 [Anaerolineae bacterium]|nr:hypothetical protein [Anaerolineae bacterium]HRA20483.1 hypothetical protein [Anaerolineae bacterium]
MSQTSPSHTASVPGRAVTAAHSQSVLAGHCFQGDSNDCGPFTVAMLVHGLTGGSVDPAGLARQLDRPRWRGLWGFLPLLRRIPGFSTFPWGLVDALGLYGMRARWQRGCTEAELRGWLAAGLGIVVLYGAWTPKPWAHYVVLLAEDPERGWGVADPGRSSKDMRWIDRESFARRWRAMGRVAVVAGGGR